MSRWGRDGHWSEPRHANDVLWQDRGHSLPSCAMSKGLPDIFGHALCADIINLGGAKTKGNNVHL